MAVTEQRQLFAPQIESLAEQYAKSMGTNYWALYNAVTDWCTHAPSKGDKGNVFLMRKKKVSKMLNMFPKRVAA